MGKQGTLSDFIFWGSKITADGDCSNEIKRCLFLGRKAMTNLDSILKSRDITLPTKAYIIKVMVFPIVMYRCKSWTIKKVKCQRIDAFKLWCWRRLLRVPWTARRSNQSILKEISPEYSLEGLMLKLQSFGHLMWRTDLLEKTLMVGKIEGRRKRGWQRMRWLDGISKLQETVKDMEAWQAAVHRVTKSWIWLSDWTIATKRSEKTGLIPWRPPELYKVISQTQNFLPVSILKSRAYVLFPALYLLSLGWGHRRLLTDSWRKLGNHMNPMLGLPTA